MFVGGSTLLSLSYRDHERKAQGLAETSRFIFSAIATSGAGVMLALLGWKLLGLMMLPVLLICLVSTGSMVMRSGKNARQRRGVLKTVLKSAHAAQMQHIRLAVSFSVGRRHLRKHEVSITRTRRTANDQGLRELFSHYACLTGLLI